MISRSGIERATTVAPVTKLERLLNLLAALLATERHLSADELRERLEGYPEAADSWRRTFERDKDELRRMGVPLDTANVPGTNPPIAGYRIDPKRYGNGTELDADELAALHLAASLVRIEGLGEDAFWRLGGRETVSDDHAGIVAELPADQNLGPLFTAASERRTVTFDYNGTERIVDAWRLSFARGHWYLSGFDHTRDDHRQFRVDRIGSVVEVGDNYVGEPPDMPLRLRGWEVGDGDPVAVSILVDESQRGWVLNEVGENTVTEETDDGSVVVTLEVHNVPAVVSFVLTMLDNAEILGPDEVRATMIERLDAIIASGERS